MKRISKLLTYYDQDRMANLDKRLFIENRGKQLRIIALIVKSYVVDKNVVSSVADSRLPF